MSYFDKTCFTIFKINHFKFIAQIILLLLYICYKRDIRMCVI